MRQKVGLLGPLLVLSVLLASSAFASSAPSISISTPPAEGATLANGSSVTFTVTDNKTAKGTKSLTCTLTNSTTQTQVAGGCNKPQATATGSTSTAGPYSGLQPGSYTFTVVLALSDGGSATTTRNFTVSPPTGTIIVTEATLPLGLPPAEAGSFTFDATGPLPAGTDYQDFTLLGSGTGHNENAQTLPPGNYTVQQVSRSAGWTLADITCTNTAGASFVTSLATATASITLGSGTTVTCTFTDSAPAPG